MEFLADSIGSPTSAKKISDFLLSQRIKVSPQIVIEYLDHLTAAFLFLRAERQNIEGKKIFSITQKYYMEDLGLRSALRGFRQSDLGKIIENAVFLKFLQDNFTVYTGQLGTHEIDFAATKGSKTLYVQVSLKESQTIHRALSIQAFARIVPLVHVLLDGRLRRRKAKEMS